MATIESSFDDGSDGWYSSSNEGAATWHPKGGNPDGYINAGSGNDADVEAPSEYLHHQTAYYGGDLTLDVLANKPSKSALLQIILTNGSVVLEAVDKEPLGPAWVHESISFRGASWFDVNNEMTASDVQLKAVLRNLTSVLVETITPAGSIRLSIDNFAFVSKGSVLSQSDETSHLIAHDQACEAFPSAHLPTLDHPHLAIA